MASSGNTWTAGSLPVDGGVDGGAFVVSSPYRRVALQVPAHRPPRLQPSRRASRVVRSRRLPPFDRGGQKLERVLKERGKTYEFNCFEGARLALLAVDRTSYRPGAIDDGWPRVFEAFGSYLASRGGHVLIRDRASQRHGQRQGVFGMVPNDRRSCVVRSPVPLFLRPHLEHRLHQWGQGPSEWLDVELTSAPTCDLAEFIQAALAAGGGLAGGDRPHYGTVESNSL